MKRMTIGCSRKEDKSSFTFTHILGVDSSRMPLGFIFPLLCLKLYWLSSSVIYSSSLLKRWLWLQV